MYLFTGWKDHKIDGKDRIVVPQAHVAELEAHGQNTLVLIPAVDQPFVEAYPADVFAEMSETQVPNRFEGDQNLRRAFFHAVEKVVLKGPGRITLPKRFLAYFPKGQVRVCGTKKYLELWDPELWERVVGSRLGGTPPTGASGSTGGGAARAR
jgi:DNA-binding transcriptional regulator/RsmH inhibitor MraZ